MLKQKRVEFHSGVCYVATLIFIVVAVLCLFGRVATVETFNAIASNKLHEIKTYTGFSLLAEYVVFYETTQYPVDYQTVAAYCNLIMVISISFMALGLLYGVLSSRQEAFKKSLWFIEIFYVIALITSILGPLQMLSRVVDVFGSAGTTIQYSFGIIPYITPIVCIVTFIIFKRYMKDGYLRNPNEPQKYGLKKATVEVTETAYQPEVVSTPDTVEVVSEEVVNEKPSEEVATEEVSLEEPVVEESISEEIVNEEPISEEVVLEENTNDEAVVEELISEEVIVEEPISEEVVESSFNEEAKECSACGQKIANDSVFCEFCGAKQE